MRLAGALLVALALGCGERRAEAIGDPCGPEPCATGDRAACVAAWPDGYCTEIDCTIGSCPVGASCVTGLEFPGVSFRAFCLAECQADTDCRSGYRCTGVGGATRVCLPLAP